MPLEKTAGGRRPARGYAAGGPEKNYPGASRRADFLFYVHFLCETSAQFAPRFRN
jgi:hypothetical protein